WRIYPTACTFDSGQEAAQQAIEDGQQFIIGPVCSEAALGAAPVAQAAEALLISPTAIHPLVTVAPQQQVRPTVFTVAYSEALQGQAAAQLAYDTLVKRRAALLYSPQDMAAVRLVEAFADQFQADGGEVVNRSPYPGGTTDFGEWLRNISEAGADLLYLPADAATANRVAAQRRELDAERAGTGSELTILGSDAWESDQLDRGLVDGSYFPVHYTSLDPNPTIQRWADTYKSVYAVEPNTLAALAYDTANILAEAIHQAQALDPLAVADMIEPSRFEGVTGPMTFDHDHRPLKPVPFVQIRDQSGVYISVIAPQPAAP
ncbi:MAG: ABC transporter substrate-binding protein, partial [Anaerolineae bacterium]|nr:ABC transporter substrate-binding protein [Anaerolineae bacterium]